MDQPEHFVSVLAALLHDVGKIWTRADGRGTHGVAATHALRDLSGLVPAAWQAQVLELVENHHNTPATGTARALRLADQLASGELVPPGPGEPASAPLRPIVAEVDLGRQPPEESWAYPLRALSSDGPRFPEVDRGGTASRADYVQIRDGLSRCLADLGAAGSLTHLRGLSGLLSALRLWTTYVPASAPGEEDEEFPPAPHVSLYDHLKLTAAIAACLTHSGTHQFASLANGPARSSGEPIALILRADFSGIQGFIYRIAASRADGTFSGAARRLRGRSLYLALLTEVVVDWFLCRLKLSPANALFIGGGRFDLLLPLRSREHLKDLERELQQWLLDTFYGELAIQVATAPVGEKDFIDMTNAYQVLEDELALGKQRKFELFVRGDAGSSTDFHTPHDQRYHACNVCHLTSLPETFTCGLCKLHQRLGTKLPKTTHIALVYPDGGDSVYDPDVEGVFRLETPFYVTVALLEDHETKQFLQRMKTSPQSAMLYRLNDVDFVPPNAGPNVAVGFRFMANVAPVDERGYPLDFDAIAAGSHGARLLGILKADIDRLGFIFAEGMKPALSATSALSAALDLYFGRRLDRLCREVSENAFYTVYAGGDDAFILGPWDQVLELAMRLSSDFRRYACRNDNITLSAGVLLVHPHFPIHRFAQLVGEALNEAKNSGRDRVSVFTRTVRWQTTNEPGYDELLTFGKDLARAVESQLLRRGFVYFLRHLHDTHFEEGIGWTTEDPMWVPRFHYALARQVDEAVIQDLDLLSRVPRLMHHIQVPVSYASLETRKE